MVIQCDRCHHGLYKPQEYRYVQCVTHYADGLVALNFRPLCRARAACDARYWRLQQFIYGPNTERLHQVVVDYLLTPSDM
jgi:hypothetical protein